MKNNTTNLCAFLTVAFVMISSQIFLMKAFADSDYACLPVPQSNPCLPGTMHDMAKVANVTISIASERNALLVNTTITTFYEMNSSAIYILQVTNDDAKGETVYIGWKPFASKSMTSASFFDQIPLQQGNYSIKVMVWAEINGKTYPLIIQPTMKTTTISA